jgi:hypothetical protein
MSTTMQQITATKRRQSASTAIAETGDITPSDSFAIASAGPAKKPRKEKAAFNPESKIGTAKVAPTQITPQTGCFVVRQRQAAVDDARYLGMLRYMGLAL